MLTVYECLTVEHDLRLVALAGFLCMFASFSALHLLARAREDVAWRRLLWILGAGLVAGSGIWATHFIAMLAYRPDYPVSYHTGVTLLSFILAVIFSTAGFAVAVQLRAAALGGAIVGLAICAMHYLGMSAISVHGYILWDRELVTASIIIGTIFAAAALETTFRLKKRIGIHAGWVLLTLAICSLHFTGMAAITISAGPDMDLPGQRISSLTLALAVAAVTFLLAIISYVGLAIERYLAHRAVQEAKRLRAYVTELEETKRQLETTSAELLVALRTASAADKAKSQFLATMSHELRTPLNAILGFSELMRLETFGALGNEHYREYADDIFRSGKHLLALINDILDFTRADAGELQLHEEEMDIAEVISETLRMIEIQAKERHILLTADPLASTLPPILADQRRVRQVLLNLLSNAVKFTPEGGSVRVDAAQLPEGIAIRVSDTGIGMAPEDIPKALERFGQIDSALARKYEGAGLGLPLSLHLMEYHGGTLTIESEPDRGTCVTITFPASRVLPPLRFDAAG